MTPSLGVLIRLVLLFNEHQGRLLFANLFSLLACLCAIMAVLLLRLTLYPDTVLVLQQQYCCSLIVHSFI